MASRILSEPCKCFLVSRTSPSLGVFGASMGQVRFRGRIRGQPITGRMTHPKATPVSLKAARSIDKLFALDGRPKTIESKRLALSVNIENSTVVSKGMPSYLDGSIPGAHVGHSLKRQSLLNRNFMEAVSDVLATQVLSDQLLSLGVQITTVKVTANCMYLHIYWICNNATDIQRINRELNLLRSPIRRSLAEKNFTQRLPHIFFVYDKEKMVVEEFKTVMKKVKEDENFVSGSSGLQTEDEEWYKEVLGRDFNQERRPDIPLQTNSKRSENFQKGFLDFPPDMIHGALGLDWKRIMTEVLASMNKSRASHRLFNATSDSLPPVEYSKPIVSNHPLGNVAQNPFEDPLDPVDRVKLMRRFLIEERKKRQKLTRDANRREVLESLERDRKRSDAANILEPESAQEGDNQHKEQVQQDKLDEHLENHQRPAPEELSILKINFMYGRKY